MLCHAHFDQLKLFVDVLDEKLVVKVVNYSTLTNGEKQSYNQGIISEFNDSRSVRAKYWIGIDDRQAAESNGEMALYFVEKNKAFLPNREALKFHKAASLIWRVRRC